MGISDKCCTTPDIPLLSKVFVKPSKPLIAVGCLILKDECGPIDCITMFWVWVTDLYMTPTLFNNISNTVADLSGKMEWKHDFKGSSEVL